jgi:hypothetical protein
MVGREIIDFEKVKKSEKKGATGYRYYPSRKMQ